MKGIFIETALVLALVGLMSGCSKKDSGVAFSSATNRAQRARMDEAHSHNGWTFKPPREFVPGTNLVGKSRDDGEYVREWNLFTTVGDYELLGWKHPTWDENALAALRAYAELRMESGQAEREKELKEVIAKSSRAAVKAGCNDPLIRYLYTRYWAYSEKGSTWAILSIEYCRAATLMEEMDYSPARKVYAYLRAGEALRSAILNLTNTPAALWDFRVGAINHLDEALRDKSMPAKEAKTLCTAVFDLCGNNVGANRYFAERVLPMLEKNWEKEGFAQALKGRIYVAKAWGARGGGWASTVTSDGWRGFKENLEIAEKAYTAAWDADKSNAVAAAEMITVCLGLDRPRKEMDTWFERAMNIDPNNYDAAYRKLNYLDPRWHGSEKEKLDFARECVASTNWGGLVPLVLADAHWELAKYSSQKDEEAIRRYWKAPGVWKDLQSSYEKYFALYPDDLDRRPRYARDAWACGEYKVMLEQLAKIGDDVDKDYFGGEAEFNEMVRVAKEKTGAR